MVALSSQGIVVVFNRISRVLQTYTENGHLVASKLLPSWEGSISSLVLSVDGLHAVIGTSCGRPLPPDTRWQSKSVPATEDRAQQPRQWDEPAASTSAPEIPPTAGEQSFAYDPQPAIILLELYTLEVYSLPLFLVHDVECISDNMLSRAQLEEYATFAGSKFLLSNCIDPFAGHSKVHVKEGSGYYSHGSEP